MSQLITPIADRLTHEWGPVPEEKMIPIRKILRNFLDEIGVMTESSFVAKLRKHFPTHCQSCSSCGLCPQTDLGKGFVGTAYGLLWVLSNKKLFVCHAGQPNWHDNNKVDTSHLRLCGNVVAIQIGHEATLDDLVARTMSEIREILQS